MSRRTRIFMAFILLLCLWQTAALLIHNDIILPLPIQVAKTMRTQIIDPSFYAAIGHTLIRILSGFCLALIAALAFALVTYFYPALADWSYPLLLVMRSVPNISYILIVLFWCSSQTSVIVISFLIIFPTVYVALDQGLHDVPASYHDLMTMYPGRKRFDLIHVYLPFLRPYLFASTSSGLSLALKVGIMAEILGQSAVGIGRQLNLCRLNLDMSGVFAWTVWIIVMLLVLDWLIRKLRLWVMGE